MNHPFRGLMREALQLTRSGHLAEATQAIQRALRDSVGKGAGPRQASPRSDTTVPRAPSEQERPASTLVLGGDLIDGESQTPAIAATVLPEALTDNAAAHDAEAHLAALQDNAVAGAQGGAGEFTDGAFTRSAQTRRYKLYAPPGRSGHPLPLIVMLHGCTQDPDDFAAGTGMNEQARTQGFFVLYPAQSQGANPSRCWNWFKHSHQQRDSGEPALLAGMTQQVTREHGIDPRRVYIAGLSAGGAMAAIVAAAYPEVFAAVGVHSGLPPGAANSVASAFAVMKNGVTGPGLHTMTSRGGATPAAPVPTIVFHGDLDQTVHPRNGEHVIAAVLGSAAPGVGDSPAAPENGTQVEQGVSAEGRRYTRWVHLGVNGKPLAEHWLVHGAGHAWAGGQAEGSYTDSSGPDATREMLRFFFEQPLRGAY